MSLLDYFFDALYCSVLYGIPVVHCSANYEEDGNEDAKNNVLLRYTVCVVQSTTARGGGNSTTKTEAHLVPIRCTDYG